MAAVISARPAMPLQKMKRPPPPLQTSINGVKSSQSSPSPSFSSKRPPPGFKQLPSATASNGVNGTTTNGQVSRSSIRRKDPQKPGDTSARQPRSAKAASGDGNNIDKKAVKRMPEPFGTLSLWSDLRASWLEKFYAYRYIFYSQNNLLYVEEIPKPAPLTYITSSPYPLSF